MLSLQAATWLSEGTWNQEDKLNEGCTLGASLWAQFYRLGMVLGIIRQINIWNKNSFKTKLLNSSESLVWHVLSQIPVLG